MDLASSFIASTESALQTLQAANTLLPPENGITLLDAKNEIFLSYLQNLALRNLVVLRSLRDGKTVSDIQSLNDSLTRKLVEHRVYLERGVRPLEQRIKYQVDKVVKAANDENEKAKRQGRKPIAQKMSRANGRMSADEDEDTEDEDEDEGDSDGSEVDELAYRPNPAAFAQPSVSADNSTRTSKSKEDGVYRPPRISATAMPNPEQAAERRDRKPHRSATVDEYISHEMSTAPVAEASIGSTIVAGGRQIKSARVLAEEAERREYEENNLVRLPKESKKDRKGQGRSKGTFGGEEWRGLGENLDRIADLTKKKTRDSALDKSRKRRAVEDSVRGDGIGSAFDVKRKRMERKQR